MILLDLLWKFFQIGLFAVGGGLATLPFLYEMSETTKWFSTTDITNMIAISQSTPGPIGVNMATYVGFLVEGVGGAVVATTGLVLPSILVIVAVSHMLERFKESQVVQAIFLGLRPASAGLILASGLSVATITFFNETVYQTTGNWISGLNVKAIVLAAGIVFLSRKKKVHPILMIVIAAALGIVFQF